MIMTKEEQTKEQEKIEETPIVEEEEKIETPDAPAEEISKESLIAEEEVSEKDVKQIVNKKKSESDFDVEKWTPKTELGRKVKSGEIKELDDIFDKGMKILEPEIVDALLPNAEIDLLLIGQSKGKFGGGQRRVFKQTQKKTKEGNKPSFSTYAVIGNRNGFIGIGYGKSRETVPAREKAFRQAKLNLIRIRRGSGSWESAKGNPDSVPYKVFGKCGSVEVTIMPAPPGTGLCIEKECAKMLELAGIKDVWSKTKGKTTTKINHVQACFAALKKLMTTKVRESDIEKLNMATGKVFE
jgi:small subunit ribosomal protein S5